MKTAVKTSAKTVAVGIRPEIDYPKAGETITSREYTFRVGAPETAEEVGVSIDQGPWQTCRNAAGYWWYDWSGYDTGAHEIIARSRAKKGRWLVSAVRKLVVE